MINMYQTTTGKNETADNASVQAYKIIKQMILEGKLDNGTVTSVAVLCKEINLGRTPVTIACQHLESEGFLTVIPKQGILIRSLSLTEAVEIYEFRSILEEYAAKKTFEAYDENDFENLQQGFIRQSKAAAAGDNVSFMMEDKIFHAYFVNKLGNRAIINSHALLYDRTFSTGVFNCKNVNRMMISINEHKMIIEALETRNYESFINNTREHVLNGLNNLFASYDSNINASGK